MSRGLIRIVLLQLAIVAAALVSLVSGAASGESQGTPVRSNIVGPAQVIDGDSLRVGNVEVRLWGIDAPEYRQSCWKDGRAWACGQAAAAALAEKVTGVGVSCGKRDTDQYGRVVAECFAGRENLNSWMVREGWALAYRRFTRKFVGVEKKAKSGRRGIWGSKFTEPWKWR